MRSFTNRQIGLVLVAMNHGLHFTTKYIFIVVTQNIHFSLPYLDPTDPFFQTVGVALLNEVNFFHTVDQTGTKSLLLDNHLA